MAGKIRFFDAEGGDTEGHALRVRGREVDVDQMRMRTADGDELTLQPEDDGERWKVTDGPDDIVGHLIRVK